MSEKGPCSPPYAANKLEALLRGRAQKAEMKIERAAAHQREELRLAELHRKHIVRQARGRMAQGSLCSGAHQWPVPGRGGTKENSRIAHHLVF